MGCVAWGRTWQGAPGDPVPAWVRDQRAEFQARAERPFFVPADGP
jgi:hypothetical protein